MGQLGSLPNLLHFITVPLQFDYLWLLANKVLKRKQARYDIRKEKNIWTIFYLIWQDWGGGGVAEPTNETWPKEVGGHFFYCVHYAIKSTSLALLNSSKKWPWVILGIFGRITSKSIEISAYWIESEIRNESRREMFERGGCCLMYGAASFLLYSLRGRRHLDSNFKIQEKTELEGSPPSLVITVFWLT